MSFAEMDAELNDIISELETNPDLANFTYREEGRLFPNVPGTRDNY